MSDTGIHTWRYKISSFLGKSLIRSIEFFISLTTKKEIYLPNERFPWVTQVEQDYPRILAEYQAFKTSGVKPLDICLISEEQYQVVKENEWDFIPLYSYGTRIDTFSRYFPATMANLDKIPHVTTAFFSILKPHTFIKEHRGAYKGYLRYQLGIEIPQPESQCGIQIEGQTYHWTAGKTVIFDDTYIHSAWNGSSETRVVLYVDFIRPMNPVLMHISAWLTRAINRSPFIQNALKNLEKSVAPVKR